MSNQIIKISQHNWEVNCNRYVNSETWEVKDLVEWNDGIISNNVASFPRRRDAQLFITSMAKL